MNNKLGQKTAAEQKRLQSLLWSL